MGLMGDMKAVQGRPIEGLTTEQHQKLTEEFKKRLQKQKEKEKEVKVQLQHDSVRTRVRQGHQQYELEHRPIQPEVKVEPKKIIADASYYSPICVPPPFSIITETNQSLDLPEELKRSSSSVLSTHDINSSISQSHSQSPLTSTSSSTAAITLTNQNLQSPHSRSPNPFLEKTSQLSPSLSQSPKSIANSRDKISFRRTKSFNNLQPTLKSNPSLHYQQISIGRIDIKLQKRSLSSSSLFESFNQSNTPNKNQLTKSQALSISISERIRLGKPTITSRDRATLFQSSPSKSTEYSINSSKITPTKLLFRPKSFSSSPRDDESITARIRRQREEYLRLHPHPHPAQENNNNNYKINRKNNEISPTSLSSSSTTSPSSPQFNNHKSNNQSQSYFRYPSPPLNQSNEKKELSITRILTAAASLQRKKKRK